jgi:hypothetical protein
MFTGLLDLTASVGLESIAHLVDDLNISLAQVEWHFYGRGGDFGFGKLEFLKSKKKVSMNLAYGKYCSIVEKLAQKKSTRNLHAFKY